MKLDTERRKQSRRPANFSVLLSARNSDSIKLKASNYSEDGLYVLINGHQLPPLGSVVKVKLSNHNANIPEPPLLEMIVKRIDSEGIGLQYLKVA